jgi:hypothetical protein
MFKVCAVDCGPSSGFLEPNGAIIRTWKQLTLTAQRPYTGGDTGHWNPRAHRPEVRISIRVLVMEPRGTHMSLVL